MFGKVRLLLKAGVHVRVLAHVYYTVLQLTFCYTFICYKEINTSLATRYLISPEAKGIAGWSFDKKVDSLRDLYM